MQPDEDPLDAGLWAAFGKPAEDGPPSVLTVVQRKTGQAPRVSLREEESMLAGANPVIDPNTDEKRALPQGRGNYQLLGEIARGGMGIVLKGHDADLGRDVALKVLHKRLADDPTTLRRFVEEAQIGGQLQHPGIVPVYEVGLMADERPFFTMKLVKGRTLATLISDQGAARGVARRMVDVFESVCQTMAYAHSRGVIHRDLKPANVMMGAFGEVQVVDWGLAKVLARRHDDDQESPADARSRETLLETVRSGGSQESSSLVGSVMGTPQYMPPEQARGEVDKLDERADVFALGAILCEILTGSPPYDGTRDETLSRAARADLDEAYARLDGCAEKAELVQLAKDCLVAAPEARPRDAGVLAERVRTYLDSESERVRAAEIEAAEARVRATQERKARMLTIGLAAAVLTALVGSGGWLWKQKEAAENRAVAAERERVLEKDVIDVLHEAGVHAALEEWGEAIAAAERAQAMAIAGSAGPAISERVDEELRRLNASADRARVLEELREDTERLLEELRRARDPVEPELLRFYEDPLVAQTSADSQERTTAAFANVFDSHGIDVLGSSVDEVTREMDRRGANAEIALFLDFWGAARRSAGEEEEAMHLLEIAHRVDPDPVRAELRTAVALGDSERIRELASSDLSAQPADTINLLAVALSRLGEEETAKDLLRRGVLTHPGSVTLHRAIADLFAPGEGHGGGGWGESAQEGLMHAWATLALQPESLNNLARVGRLYNRTFQNERAVEVYEKVLEQRPDSTADHLGLAYALESERALDEFRAARGEGSTSSRRFWSHEGAAFHLRYLGDLEGAIEEQRQALELSPNGSYPRTFLFELLVMTGDLEEAERIFDERPLESPYYWRSMAESFATSRPDRLQDPSFAEHYYERALYYAEQATLRDPGIASNWTSLALTRLQRNEFAEARHAAEQAIELGDGVGTPLDWFVMASACAEIGENLRARLWYERGRGWLDMLDEDDDDLTVRYFARDAARRIEALPSPF